ncbi:MAG TPA: phosphate ABC transporter permease subunit PstC [Acidimicrobiales bacterium]|nr:phosphate ABC transporter permease subunit PstC [Acidimicrobiales bacterium]
MDGSLRPPRLSGRLSGGDRGKAGSAKRHRLLNGAISVGSGFAAVVPFVALVAMVVVLLVEAWPAVRYDGIGFITSSTWTIGSVYSPILHSGGVAHLAGAQFGSWPLVVGTLESSAIALFVGLPIAVGAAVLVVEKLPAGIGAGIGICLEVLAGIPSVVIGVWGALTFGPWIAKAVYPALSHLPNIPPFDVFRGSVGAGEGLLTSGFVLAAMIIPIIAATTRDLLRQVPETTKEGAEALGMTEAEVFRRVQARWVRTGVIGAAVLGLGRALGETMAVAIISGSQDQIAHNIYGVMTTIAATIVTTLDAAQADPSGLAVRALAELALVLLVITLVANIGARIIVRRSAHGAVLPVGAGF